MPRPIGVPRSCSIASALDVIGERWSLLVLREVHYGVHRFGDIQRNTGAPKDILAKRISTLLEVGVLEKRQYLERPPRFEYHPTPSGNELRPVLLLLDQWGTTWLTDSPHSDTVLLHDCGTVLHAHMKCDDCGQPVTGTDITAVESAAS
ncbi:transcriptional regulator [Rhodococcus sp. 06-412-2C]|uniref:winged helix-turn-helix transcriptional regulator n=1 Tax=unclassified Rhodococcus (in: high G+C Gram-positive bacteria) TaxID=192944 RepID=UPI000B9BB5CC|nr:MULTISPECIES: helix-turn-helix domain-containing protein [unclassified Rhodococcus (in: high G+C Gram-positive bacteria)]OZC83946.1 transcriptional regulator [Rhodococcus sp. 06-412-2C]OZC94134.1 transcriptional regulator [Rhodococcus sp. 06-412-2B]